MGFLEKVKRAVSGPISIEVDAADSFSWTDDTLPVPVTLTNGTDQTQQVAEVRAAIEVAAKGDAKFTYKGVATEPFTLAPGERVERVVTIHLGADTSPASLQAGAAAAGLPDVPDFLAKAMSRKMGPPPKPRGRLQISVVVKLADSSRLSNVHASIQAR